MTIGIMHRGIGAPYVYDDAKQERIDCDPRVIDALLGIEGEWLEENAKLRELVQYMYRCYVRGHDWGPYGAPEKQHVEDAMSEMGIEV